MIKKINVEIFQIYSIRNSFFIRKLLYTNGCIFIIILFFLMSQNTNSEQPIELVYWNIRGVAQPIRHLLEYLNIQYVETKCLCPYQWFNQGLDEIKKKCLFPNLPYINDNDFCISEGVAICKYLCKKVGRSDLLGKTIEDQAKVDQYLAKFVIHRNKLSDIFKKDFLEGQDQRLKKQKLNTLYIDLMSNQYMPSLIKVLRTRDWIMGYLTIADFFAYESVFYLTGIFSERTKQFSQINRFKQNFQNLEQIKQYNQSNRVMLKTFMSTAQNIWKGDSRYC